VSDKILISDRSSLIMDECPCTNGFVDEWREISLSVFELHTWRRIDDLNDDAWAMPSRA
jgi:hypothetical protein